MTATIGSLFSGYGGLEMGVRQVIDARTAWVSDIKPAACKLLAHRYPDVPNLGDITQINWQEVRKMAWPSVHDERACAMYSRYQQGLSLEQVGEEFGRSRQAVFGLFKSRGWEMRPKVRLETVYFLGQSYTMRNTGYYGATSGDRHLLHRAVWEHHNGTIPEGWDIHHRDEDKTNNDISNLECLPKAEHTRLYSPSCNQFSHKCGCDEEVMPQEAPGVDILTGGFP
jgi:hypothetical protein